MIAAQPCKMVQQGGLAGSVTAEQGPALAVADAQIEGHLQDLLAHQQADGGWPIRWEPPGPAAALEWRGRVTLEAIRPLAAYGWI